MTDSIFILQTLIVVITIVLFMAAALLVLCGVALYELREGLRRLRRGPEVHRDANGRPFKKRI